MSPFPLFPGEMLEGVPKAIKRLPVVRENEAITLLALMEYEDEENGVTRQAGEMWQLKGPRTYVPVPEVVSVRPMNDQLACTIIPLFHWLPHCS